MNSERSVSKAYAKRRTFQETNQTPIWVDLNEVKGLFTWSGGPRSSGVSFFCFHALGDTKQKKLTH